MSGVTRSCAGLVMVGATLAIAAQQPSGGSAETAPDVDAGSVGSEAAASPDVAPMPSGSLDGGGSSADAALVEADATPPSAVEAAPQPDPPVSAAPVEAPAVSPIQEPAPAPPPDQDMSAAHAPEPWSPPVKWLGVEVGAGLGVRVGSSGTTYEHSDRAGLSLSLGAWFAPDELFALGLSYARTSLGNDVAPSSDQTLSVERDMDSLWLAGRAYPYRADRLGIFLQLGLGLSWQHAHASGTRRSTPQVTPPTSYVCDASAGPGVALGGGLGLDLAIERRLAFVTQLNAAAHRLSADRIGACTPGAGSVAELGASLGFAYRFDLGDQSSR